MRRGVLLALALLAGATTAGAAQEGQRCTFRLQSVGDSGVQVTTPAGTNYFAGGGVHITCQGTAVSMISDSVAAYGGKLVQFIGNVHYRDSTVTLDADNGTYFKDGERWEARGRVKTTNLKTGSTLTGPSVDYLRVVKGVRDTAEMFAVGRPTIRYVTKDSAGVAQEPYIVVGDRIRQRGDEKLWAGGKVTIDRSDFSARADSLRLETGKDGSGTLVRDNPVLRGLGKDSFNLAGTQIDFALSEKDIRAVKARGDAHAVTKDLDLVADTIEIDLKDQKAEQTRAWGTVQRPLAVSKAYEVRADSLAVDTPGQQLRQVRAFSKAWIGTEKDSASAERDWIAGDTVVADFAPRDSGGKDVTRLVGLESRVEAKSFYRSTDKPKDKSTPPKAPGLNYARADRIVVHMRDDEEGGVEKVDLFGNVDGVQLDPAPPGKGTAAAKADEDAGP
ncbi:MAG TPA: hypothetical protein VFY20_10825 [Gemmatimonadales bacterium]|nr:hypothetical protein [Gemmatimonadales bacterium]